MGANCRSSSQAYQRLTPAIVRAVDTIAYLVQAAGPGTHRITTAAQPTYGEPLAAHAHFDVIGEGAAARWRGTHADAAAVAEVATLAFIVASGSVVLATSATPGKETVRGWLIDGRALRPLTADQIHRAYRESPGPVPSDSTFLTAFPVPPYTPTDRQSACRQHAPQTRRRPDLGLRRPPRSLD
ncbi:hypothetical protein ABZX77_47475 [Streptomyces sp. NPDC004237]|uniref:hypothetical protein n=1 Tax=Streptomyces sp. NPDC004237 TaxID=3154455 RepID=UPI0033A6AD72